MDNEKEEKTISILSPVIQGKKVLVIEDNDVNIMFLTMLLKKVGIQYEIAKDGELGLQLFKDNSYDIILTDSNVPNATLQKYLSWIFNFCKLFEWFRWFFVEAKYTSRLRALL